MHAAVGIAASEKGSLPGLLGYPGPALLPAALLLAALPEEAALVSALLAVAPEDTAQPLFGQTVLMRFTTSVGDMPYLSWTKASTETKVMSAAFPAARSCGSAAASGMRYVNSDPDCVHKHVLHMLPCYMHVRISTGYLTMS